MNNNFNSKVYYEQLLRKHMGLITVFSKIPVRDKNALSLVYTPGVGSSCLKIQKDSKLALKYTNKMNSVLVVTDSTAFKHYSQDNNMVGIPYVEASAAYYKISANIDCYPLVLDSSLISNGKEMAELVTAIMPGYSLIEFLGVDEKRLEEFRKSIGKNDFGYLTVNKRKLDEEEVLNGIEGGSSYMIFSAVIRVSLDFNVLNQLDDLISFALNYIRNKVKVSSSGRFLFNDVFLELLCALGEFIVQNQLSAIEITDKNHSFNKFKQFLTLGKIAWVEKYPSNYFSSEHSNDENSLMLHERYKGIIESGVKIEKIGLNLLEDWENLDHISELLHKNPEEAYKLTCKSNMGSIITNGTAVLGFGDIGTLAGLPVMEGKSVLFKLFGGVDIFPLCINCKDPKLLIRYIRMISPILAAINLEDIKSPECFEVEQTLADFIDYPVFHDDQHGTAIIVIAGILNSCKLLNMKLSEMKIVINGAGAAGLSVSQLLQTEGAKNIIVCDTSGAIYSGRPNNMNEFKERLAKNSNPLKESGKLSDVIKNANIFIGLSAPRTLTKEMVKSMSDKPVIFALANPEPEIMPDEAKEAGAYIVATGRSDFKNQINNSLAFPGIFRGAIDVRAKNVNIEMKLAASHAISSLMESYEFSPEKIIPDSLDSRVPIAVATAVAREAVKSGVARLNIDEKYVQENMKGWILEGKLKNWDDINSIMRTKF